MLLQVLFDSRLLSSFLLGCIDLIPSGEMVRDRVGRDAQYAINFNDPYFDGQIDDFRIYNRSLNATENEALAEL